MKDNQISYIEFKAKDLEKIKKFYSETFEWNFTDYGPEYTSFSNSGVSGGFELTNPPAADEITNSVLIVLYHKDLESLKKNIQEAGGKISRDIFSFPGGRRFHFIDPSGNELAVWSDK